MQLNKIVWIILIFWQFNVLAQQLRIVPWLTETAIVFLDNFCKENKQAKILEFGCGGSTIWLSKRTPNLITIEHDSNWYQCIKDYLNQVPECNSVDLRYIPRPYYEICANFPDNHFDLVLIDGKDRVKCTKYAISKLKPGGILMLDNSERYYYSDVYELLCDWKICETEQNGPDNLGFWYPGWKTTWWVKPDNNKPWSAKLMQEYWCEQGHFNIDQAQLFQKLSNYLMPRYVLETGFCTGRSAISVLLSCSPIKFVSVDINLDYIKPNGRIYAKKLSEQFKCFQVIEGNSSIELTDEFFKRNFPDGLDWVTIDGDHSYNGCSHDLTMAAKYLNQSGIIIVDDYQSGPPNGTYLPEVTQAVDDFIIKNPMFLKSNWNKYGKGFAILFKDNKNQVFLDKIESI